VTKIDGKPVGSMEDVIRVIDSKQPGDQVTVALLRGKDERNAKVTLGNRPASAGSSFQPQSPQTVP
jgi:S1-C subfamily serine protease